MNHPFLALATFLIPSVLTAQKVRIGSATPAAVTDSLRAYLEPQGFKAVSADGKGALLTLDRGEIRQTNLYSGGHYPSSLFHVVIELHVHYKQKNDSLEVSAEEVAVGTSEGPGEAFRRPVNTPIELQQLQALLNHIRDEFAGTALPRDSVIH